MEIIKGKCTDISSEGKGVVKVGSHIYFVDGLFVGEEAELLVQYQRSGVYFAKVKNLIKKSPVRIQPKCKICTSCGGCQYQQIDYKAQIEYKTNRVKNAIKRIAKVDVEVNDCLGAEHPYNYRNKIQVPFSKDRNGKVIYGFYKENSHIIMPVKECAIENKKAVPILWDIKCLIENSDQSIINNCNDTEILLKQYEVYLKTSEDLVSRRQSVSNFYISVNTALLTVLSAIIAIINIIDAKYSPFVSICTGLFISLLGAALCLNWKRIIQSYGELNSAKMKVISKIEKYLPFNLYDTEWKIQCSNLGKKKYKSFTTLEKTIPLIFLIVYGIAFIASIILLFINL